MTRFIGLLRGADRVNRDHGEHELSLSPHSSCLICLMSEEDRFAFGKNWQAFLAGLSEDQIDEAVKSLRLMLSRESLEGHRFLDLGCGSGLFSLAAQRLGAEVVSVDFDVDSVACTEQLRQRFGDQFPTWDDHSRFGAGRFADELARNKPTWSTHGAYCITPAIWIGRFGYLRIA